MKISLSQIDEMRRLVMKLVQNEHPFCTPEELDAKTEHRVRTYLEFGVTNLELSIAVSEMERDRMLEKIKPAPIAEGGLG